MKKSAPWQLKVVTYLVSFITASLGVSLWLPFISNHIPLWDKLASSLTLHQQYLVSLPFVLVGPVIHYILQRSDNKRVRKVGEVNLTISMMILVFALIARPFYMTFVASGQYRWGMVKEFWAPKDPLMPSLKKGLMVTIKVVSISFVLALILGTISAVGRTTKNKVIYGISTAYVEFFRNTPLMVQLFLWFFGLTVFLSAFNLGLAFRLTPPAAGIIGLSFYTGAYMSEAIRAGILSIDKGQWEAAHSLALTPLQTLQYIILPQAFRIVIPPLASQFINLYKNSTVIMTIGVTDLLFMANEVEAQTFRGFEVFTAATLIYLAGTLTLSAIMNGINYVISGEKRARTGTHIEKDWISVTTEKIGEITGTITGFLWNLLNPLFRTAGQKIIGIGAVIMLLGFSFSSWFDKVFSKVVGLPHGGTGWYLLLHGHGGFRVTLAIIPVSAIVILIGLIAERYSSTLAELGSEILYVALAIGSWAPLVWLIWIIGYNNSRDVYFTGLGNGIWWVLLGSVIVLVGVSIHVSEVETGAVAAKRQKLGWVAGLILLIIGVAAAGKPYMITNIKKGMASPTKIAWDSIIRNFAYLIGGSPLAEAKVGVLGALWSFLIFTAELSVLLVLLALPLVLLWITFNRSLKLGIGYLVVLVAAVWFAKHAGVHIPLKQVDNIQGLKLTFFLASISIIASFILGVIAGMARLSKYPFISVPAIAYIELIRGVPLFMFIIYMFITIPQVVKGMEHISNWESALIAFILFTSTYIGEIVRAGIQSIDKGQWEAAHSLGLNYWLTMTQIVLPQAIKRMIPPTVSQFIALFKDTSLAYYIGVIEFFRTITITYNREYNATFSLLLFGALVYFIFSYAMSVGAEKLRRSMGAQETI